MSLALIYSRSLLGLQAHSVTVEVHLANGLPSFTLVGLADTEVKEARERVRCALQNSGFEFPHNKRITVNLAPADLPKDSGRFDLPIALGILAAAGELDVTRRPRNIMTFSHGAHHCLGAAAARMQARVALTELLARCPDFEVDESAIVFAGGNYVRRPLSVPIRVESRFR